MQKGFALPLVLVSILLVSLIGATIYYYYQSKPDISQDNLTPQPSAQIQKDETASWKIYTNKTYLYKIKYPQSITLQNEVRGELDETPNLEILQDLGEPGYKIARIRLLEPEIERDPKVFHMEPPITKMTNLTLKVFVEKLWSINKEEGSSRYTDNQVSDISETTIGGSAAYQFTVSKDYKHSTGGGELVDEKTLLIYTEKHGKIYNLIVPTNEPVLNQIISTVKFLE